MTTQTKVIVTILLGLLFVMILTQQALINHARKQQNYIDNMPKESRECPKLKVQARLL